MGLAWASGEHRGPAQQAEWVQEVQGLRYPFLRSPTVGDRRHRGLFLRDGVPEAGRGLHEGPAPKRARNPSHLWNVREGRPGGEDQPGRHYCSDDIVHGEHLAVGGQVPVHQRRADAAVEADRDGL